MLIESWDRTSLGEQEQIIGRAKTSGAPLGWRHEHDPVDLAARGPDGLPLIAVDAHVRLASHATNGGIRLLRRGYSFTDGIDPVTGELDAGLFFISFQRDPERFAIIQRRLGATDHLDEYISHKASAVFAIPPGSRHGEPLGAGLFGAV